MALMAEISVDQVISWWLKGLKMRNFIETKTCDSGEQLKKVL